jgi:hypothetical protein
MEAIAWIVEVERATDLLAREVAMLTKLCR